MYKSLIDGHECTEHHYLAEFVIARKAKKLSQPLPPKFWNTNEWKKEYKMQVIAAHSLLKIFETQDILSALRSKQGNWIYSLQNRTLVDIIDQERQRRESATATQEKIKQVKVTEIDNSNETVVKPVKRTTKNVLDTLEDIDADVQRNSF